MTNDEANAHADGMLMFLKKYPPAEAMLILTALNVKALLAATPDQPLAMEKSLKLMFGEVVEGLRKAILTPMGGVQ